MSRVLLLNADWKPLHFINDCRAICMLIKGRCEIVVDFQTGLPALWDDAFTSPARTPNEPLNSIQVPAVLRLKSYVHKKGQQPRFRKKALFNRDDWRCQYCGIKLHGKNIEIEHILPSSRGGTTSWLNCVASCKSCNKKKANKTPDEAGMPLLRKPTIPTQIHFWDVLSSGCWHATWSFFITRNNE